MKLVIDGNEAAAYAAYAFTEIAGIYPITPSSPMAEKTDEWSALGRENIFGQQVQVVEMQSEAGAIGTVHGALEAGTYATSYSSAQGLLLMIPVMHRIAGTRLPAVLHIASRTVGQHAMSIFGDHSDVMNCRQTGFAILSSGSVQEVMDLGAVAHLSAIESSLPFLHFFDGFRLSHEIQKIDALDYGELKKLVDWDAVARFRSGALNPEHPTLRNTVQNPDVFFQFREANNKYYEALPAIVEENMHKINKLTGKDYQLFNYYGAPDADRVIGAMGAVCGTIRETVDYLNAKGEKVGLLQVHLYRPFSVKHFLDAMPKSVKRLCLLDRTKEMGAISDPLCEDVCALYANRQDPPLIIGGRFGLSSKDTTPSQILAAFKNLEADEPKRNFIIGVNDDVTGTSLVSIPAEVLGDGTVNCKFWGLASDGTVGANKNSVKIIGEHTDQYVQAYFEFDTKKSYGVTRSHLRFGKNPIQSSYLIHSADFVAVHNQLYLDKYDTLSELKQGGTVLLNCDWAPDELEEKLPSYVKKTLAEKEASFYIIDANEISRELGLGDKANAVLQAAFFSLAEIVPAGEAIGYMKDAVRDTFRLKGEEIVDMNLHALDKGLEGVKKIEVPAVWADLPEVDIAAAQNTAGENEPDFIKNIVRPINYLKGDDLPVSAFENCSDGTFPVGTTEYEKRGIATQLPVWTADKCIQCNRCAFVCPHAVIRPYILDGDEAAKAPDGFVTIPANGKELKDFAYSLQFSDLDCTGCGCCEVACPSKEKAINMVPVHQKPYAKDCWEYGLTIQEKEGVFDVYTVKGSQFKQPLCEFSGACAGCGETPYAKLLTQLYGDRMYWVNATGCSQAWGSPMPSFPYTKNHKGKGPAWSNSLFEDNAEYAFGMALSVRQQRTRVLKTALALKEKIEGQDALHKALDGWIEHFDDKEGSSKASEYLLDALGEFKPEMGSEAAGLAEELLAAKDQFVKKTVWMYGGDGWAYGIGFGGLDHVLATGEDVNVFVVDTEVYSNTGGQSSKATPLGAVAQFQSSGKKSPKKDLGRQMMPYGNIYIASVAMGADMNQLMKALKEAEDFPGPSLVIAYTPCIAHGIKAGMANIQTVMKNAVESGYWTLYRYDPRQDVPFQLDSKEPTKSYREFIEGETRYSSLEISFPDNAKRLFTQAEKDAEARYKELERLSKP